MVDEAMAWRGSAAFKPSSSRNNKNAISLDFKWISVVKNGNF